MRLATFLFLVLLLARPALPSEPIDFRNDLIPVFTKFGCNSGACHGAAIGRGGFKLSLYGGDPDSDFLAVAREIGGRRINVAKPEESLLFLKPAEYIAHGGGTVLDDEGDAAELILQWIRQGGSKQATRELARVHVDPQQITTSSLDEPIPIRTIAHYTDGTQRDVTRWTVFAPEDESAASVRRADDDSGSHIQIHRRGRHIVVARYLTEVVPVEIVAPLSDELWTEELPNQNFIDLEIHSALKRLGLQPSPASSDAAFLRRITLDLTGRLPSQAQVEAWLSTARENPMDSLTRRAQVVDELLRSDSFTEYWTLQFAKLLRIRPSGEDSQGSEQYHAWLRDKIRERAGYDELARELILAEGDSHAYGPANFYRTTKGPREQAEFFSELWMGSRLRCANCHNHPLDHWTQDDYHGLAAIFARVEGNRMVLRNPKGIVIHPRTREPAVARIPGTAFLSEGELRSQLADWLTAEDNPYFAKAIVNRLWKHMLGRGLVEPVDDFRATNPATHPALLDQLAEDFIAHHYDVRHTLRQIAVSHTYGRSSIHTSQNRDDDTFYSHAFRRPLEPEVLSDAISDVLGLPVQYGEHPLGTRAIALVDPSTKSETLDILGRCDREASCEGSTTTGGLPQKLHLFNGSLLNSRLSAKDSRLSKLVLANHDPANIIREFYVVALGRTPTPQEALHWKTQLEAASNQSEFLEDFVWGLLTSQEFTNNG